MKKLTTILVITLSIIILGINKNQILDVSKSNPERAWGMFLDYVLENPTDTSLENIGHIIKAKLTLKNISGFDFAIQENFDEFINYVQNTTPPASILNSLLTIFPQTNESVRKAIETPEFDTFNRYLRLLKIVNPEINSKIAGKNLVNFFVKYPTFLSYDNISLLKLSKYSKDIGTNMLIYIATNINDFDEKNIPIIARIIEIAKELGGNLSSSILKAIETYASITRRLSENLTQDELFQIKKEITELPVKHSLLTQTVEKKLNNINENSEIKNIPENLNIKKNTKKDFNIIPWLSTSLLFILISFRIIRFYIFYIFGLKKLAALTYKKIVNNSPMDEEKHLRLAQLYEEAGMYDEALEEYNLIKRLKL
ncbi:tetratricopeptide repeat protein [Thermosipho ferrireducens]|uniref:Tetratricopeptide repeat protein n=1 Tax=Thermosipho ferrireducens TaxID=2571116 RepID=A0ABX7S5N9_9BACT|nr:tetratricopeptide repeat protein [Thermosipho ferrireducens]QTA37869.1 tetratricopeptide repeat protein [Thermosipho ferrireducens]